MQVFVKNSIEAVLMNSELLSFYGWWQFTVCAFAFLALLAIWYHIGRKQKDFGQIWLALSVLCWSCSGLVEVYFANYALVDGRIAFRAEGWRSIFSLFNSLFILLALPWFKYIPKQLQPIISSKFWYLIIGLPFLFSLLPTLSKMISGSDIRLIAELDVYYALLTLGFLGFVLFTSFSKRRLQLLAYLSIICILFTFGAQILKLTGSQIDQTLFSAIFKTSLIMIFFALALSWVKELTENVLPEAGQLFLRFDRQKLNNGKLQHLVHLGGLQGSEERQIALTPALFNLLYKFAQRKKGDKEDWLEIKPKKDARSDRLYDISDHNQIKRLLVCLLDGLFGKDAWTNEQHLKPLKATLFEMSEKRERKIRLRVPARNLSL